MSIYQSKYQQLPGTSHEEAIKSARDYYDGVRKHNPRRRPHIRSIYFSRDKVFLQLYWDHLMQKNRRERIRRARLFRCALDLIQNTRFAPDTIIDTKNTNILLHRFYGKSAEHVHFCVQIIENKRSRRKDLISCFPIHNTNK